MFLSNHTEVSDWRTLKNQPKITMILNSFCLLLCILFLVVFLGFENNIAGDCDNGLSTVYRIKADRCGRLWVLDVGTVGIGEDTRQVCPYAINIFDLNTDTRIRRYEFRPEDTNSNTFIANTLVEVGDDCNDAYAYFSDELGYGLIVYSFEENNSWRFEHGFFYPDPLRGDFNIGGLNFQWAEEGIFGLALGPRLADNTRALFFSPLASHREFYVSTEVLKNKANVEGSYNEFKSLEERAKDGHTTSRVIDEQTGVMLYNLIDQNAVGCWNSATEYTPANHGVVDRNDETMIFPADVKVDAERTVWVISDRMPNFLIATLDRTDVNFRIFTAPMDTLIAGTVCATNGLQSQTLNNRLSGTDQVAATNQQVNNANPTSVKTTLVPTTASRPVSSTVALPAPIETNQPISDRFGMIMTRTPPTAISSGTKPTATSKKPWYHGNYDHSDWNSGPCHEHGHWGDYHGDDSHHKGGYRGHQDWRNKNQENQRQGRGLDYGSWLW